MYLILFFIPLFKERDPQKLLLQFMLKSILPNFSSNSFMVSGITFRYLIHFEFIFMYSLKKPSNFTFLTCCCPVLPILLIEEDVISPLYSLVSFVIDQLTIGIWVYFWDFILFCQSIFLFLCHTILFP